MPDPIVYIDRSKVREGRLAELEAAVAELAGFAEANEPRLIGYSVFFNESRTEMTVMHVHRDAASLEFHMEVAGPLFPRFADLVDLEAIDVYGTPTDGLVDRMRSKAELLGAGAVHVHDHHAGFMRFPG